MSKSQTRNMFSNTKKNQTTSSMTELAAVGVKREPRYTRGSYQMRLNGFEHLISRFDSLQTADFLLSFIAFGSSLILVPFFSVDGDAFSLRRQNKDRKQAVKNIMIKNRSHHQIDQNINKNEFQPDTQIEWC